MDEMTRAYLECALWSSCEISEDGEMGEALDGLYTVDDVDAKSVTDAESMLLDFCSENMADLDGLEDAQIGHDVWLTRNRHGAGFWDRGLGAIGEPPTESCQAYGSSYAYVGDDGVVYLT